MLDPKAVGKRLIMSPRTVSEMANDGRLPAYRIGIYLRFKWAEIEKYLEVNCQCMAVAAAAKVEALADLPNTNCKFLIDQLGRELPEHSSQAPTNCTARVSFFLKVPRTAELVMKLPAAYPVESPLKAD